MQDIPKILYLCDGKAENCKKGSCYQRGGDCRHTADINHAANFQKPYKNSGFIEYERGDGKRNIVMKESVELSKMFMSQEDESVASCSTDNKVDELIVKLTEHIIGILAADRGTPERDTITEKTGALAELITARTKMER